MNDTARHGLRVRDEAIDIANARRNRFDRRAHWNILSPHKAVLHMRPCLSFDPIPYPHIPEANARIAQLTGARFGSAYDQLLKAGEMVMNSLDAAAALAVLRELAPERAIQWAHQLQQAFYERGQSLSERATIARIASEGGLDARAVLSRLQDGSAVAAAEADFALARRLGVSTYPTLLLVNGQEAHSLPANGVGLDDMNRRLDALLA